MLPVTGGAAGQGPGGASSIVVGDSATWPVPGSGQVSREQAALLMMQRVADAEVENALAALAAG